MQPLGDKILVRDIKEGVELKEGLMKETISGILTVAKEYYKKVEVVSVSPDSKTKLKKGDICLANPGGVELEPGLWLCNEQLLDCKL